MGIVTAFERAVNPDWMLERNGSFWKLVEPKSSHSLLEIGGCKSYGFTLDWDGRNKFPFFCKTPPEGLNKANDGIVVAETNDESFVVAVEMKASLSPSSMRDALKQMESGRYFLEWMIALFNLHGHWSGKYGFIGVISLKPRRQERKGVSRRCAEIPDPELHKQGYPVFVLLNHPKISIPELVRRWKASVRLAAKEP